MERYHVQCVHGKRFGIYVWIDLILILRRSKVIILYRIYFGSIQSGVEMLSYVEVHNVVWSVCVCSCIDYDSFVLYYICWSSCQTGTKMSSYVELYEHIEICDGTKVSLCVDVYIVIVLYRIIFSVGFYILAQTCIFMLYCTSIGETCVRVENKLWGVNKK